MEPTPAARRLVARAARPAVRAGDPVLGTPIVEAEGAVAGSGPRSTAVAGEPPAPTHVSSVTTAAPDEGAPAEQEPVAADAAAPPARLPRPAAAFDPDRAPGRRAVPAAAAIIAPAPLEPQPAPRAAQGAIGAVAPVPIAVTETTGHGAATTAASATEAAFAWLASGPTPPADGQAEATVAGPPPPASSVLTAAMTEPAPAERSGQGSTIPAPGPPREHGRGQDPTADRPVVIERIDIITPPARPPEPDPFASLAARRAGLSRHREGR